VIPINIGVVIWCLFRTRAEGRRYGGQVAVGAVMGLVAAILIFCNSLLFTQVLFPNYTEEALATQEEMLRASGMDEQMIAAQIERAEQGATPMAQARNGAIGTFATTLVTTLIAAAFIRKKD
jgi:hypothetical protein